MCTCSNSSDQRLEGDSPGVVPGPDDEDHPQWLWLHINLIRYGEEVLLYRPRSRPLCQLFYSQLNLSLQSQSLKQLSPMFTLKAQGGTRSSTLQLLV